MLFKFLVGLQFKLVYETAGKCDEDDDNKDKDEQRQKRQKIFNRNIEKMNEKLLFYVAYGVILCYYFLRFFFFFFFAAFTANAFHIEKERE